MATPTMGNPEKAKSTSGLSPPWTTSLHLSQLTEHRVQLYQVTTLRSPQVAHPQEVGYFYLVNLEAGKTGSSSFPPKTLEFTAQGQWGQMSDKETFWTWIISGSGISSYQPPDGSTNLVQPFALRKELYLHKIQPNEGV
jgi:hypothetical protein